MYKRMGTKIELPGLHGYQIRVFFPISGSAGAEEGSPVPPALTEGCGSTQGMAGIIGSELLLIHLV